MHKKDELVNIARPGGFPWWVTKEESARILASRTGERPEEEKEEKPEKE